jgi:ribosomal-protein-alanine N-acetyltransferase
MIMEPTIETERMILRRFNIDDAADFLDLNSDPEVVRYAEKTVMKSLEEARQALLSAPLKDYEQYGYGRFAVIRKSDEELVGFCGMKFLPELNLNELGYRLKKKCWGLGLATEAAAATLRFARDTLELDYAIALILEGNIGSVRVAEKLGMKQNGMTQYMGLSAMKYELYLSQFDA